MHDSDDRLEDLVDDLSRARGNLARLERTPRHRIADMQAFLDNVANQRAYVAKLRRELEEAA